MKLKICHLYPDLLNLHSDQGNMLIFCRRAEWRGIQVEIDYISLPEKVHFTDYDFIFLGGGTDQGPVYKDLLEKGPFLLEAVENGSVLLSICLGYQLLGLSFKKQDGTVLPGVGIFDAYTEEVPERLQGNILLETAPDLQDEIKRLGGAPLDTLIGFENHPGRTYLGKKAQPLGRVIKGHGNNGEDKTEGARYKNALGTYLHGPLLSKNPHLADLLLTKALYRSSGDVHLDPLNDDLEIYAHNVMKKRLR